MITFRCSVHTITVAATICVGVVRSVAPVFQPRVDIRSCSGIASFLVTFLSLLGVRLAAVSVVRLVPTLFVCSFTVAARVRQFVLALQLAT